MFFWTYIIFFKLIYLDYYLILSPKSNLGISLFHRQIFQKKMDFANYLHTEITLSIKYMVKFCGNLQFFSRSCYLNNQITEKLQVQNLIQRSLLFKYVCQQKIKDLRTFLYMTHSYFLLSIRSSNSVNNIRAGHVKGQ